MAHRRLQREEALSQQPAIFSPSLARAAASTAKDWAYVDAWLKHKYASASVSGSTAAVPPFERNADTLHMLLALVAANEAADEERDLLTRVERAALDEVRAVNAAKEARRADLLAAIEDNLSREGRTALDAMAGMAAELGVADTEAAITPELLASRFVELQASAVEVDRATARVEVLHEHIRRETARITDLVDAIRQQQQQALQEQEHSKQPGQRDNDLEHKIDTMQARLPQLEKQASVLNKVSQMPTVTVDEVKHDEDEYLRVLARKKELDARVKAFAGLPPDVEAARVELENLRAELRSMTDRRDHDFEKLVERESPVKPRRRM
ncbi:hypothetical protein Micbo1qcDRAFT_120260 [Microdochium bolleyi]|uniref:HAUS augmin-like complex subunit 1 n=1 Tax=Microdochium bolleyi TaxID=196109 RepID=A0A136J0N1_9PEZI|nr:hypothetical protein Micbo1qcDRAFT_120260 [Microdochium bolleyi]